MRGLRRFAGSPVGSKGARHWALHGVTGDELSTTVLVAGFTPAGPGALASTLAAWASTGQA